MIRATRAWAGARDCIELIALTACRSGEARGALWSEVDLEARTWTIQADRTKTETEHIVPLCERAIAVIERARQYRDASGLVFPSSTGKMMGDSVLSKLWKTCASGTVHGLRSGFRDWAAENGTDRELAESALAHVLGVVEAAYRRSTLVEWRRDLMAQWGQYLLGGVD